MTSATGKRDTSENVLRRLADNAPMIVWEIDIDNRCIYLNPEAMQGLSGPDAISPLEWLKFIHPVDFPGIYEIWKSARKN